MNLTLAEVAKLANGIVSDNSNTNLIIKEVVIDSRNVINNHLFVAIKGDSDDGHRYLESLFSKFENNIAALVSDKSLLNKYPNLIYVSDTTHALGILGSNYRQKFNIPVVGITGSNGKTTVKEMLKSICIHEFGEDNVLATVGTLNNHWGMPLTLLALDTKHKVAIIEMGMNHSGEMDYLSNLAKPSIVTVINVMMAHAGFFNDLSDIARAKGEIYHGLLNDGIACVNLNVPFYKLWINDIGNKPIFNYGIPGTDCYLLDSKTDGTTTIVTNRGQIKVKLKVLGQHNQENAVVATALALKVGCSIESITNGLNNYVGYKGRLELKTAFNGALIIDDSYNGNPDSVKAGIRAIENLSKPHWVILGDLGELGKYSDEAHSKLGEFANQNGIEVLLTYGEHTKHTHNSFKGIKRHFIDKEQLIDYCKNNLPSNATLFVKGSKTAKLYEVIDKLV